jgi:hypothetical protein
LHDLVKEETSSSRISFTVIRREFPDCAQFLIGDIIRAVAGAGSLQVYRKDQINWNFRRFIESLSMRAMACTLKLSSGGDNGIS